MKTLHVIIKNKIATYQKRDGDIVCDNSDYQIQFTFDAEWEAHEAKTARFIYGGEFTDVVFTGDTCPVPVLSNIELLAVGVFAGDLVTSTPALISCIKSIRCDGGAPAEPTPDVYDQIMAMLSAGTLRGKDGYTPKRGEDYWTAADIKEIDAHNIDFIASELAKRGQLKPEFANSVEECTDTTKLYVLPDGYIYGYILSTPPPPEITIESKSGGYWSYDAPNARFMWLDASGWSGKLTNKIPVTAGDQLTYKGKIQYGGNKSYVWLNAANIEIASGQLNSESSPTTITAPTGATYLICNSFSQSTVILEVEWVVCQAAAPKYMWASTGHAFVPADYEDRIVGLEGDVAVLKSGVNSVLRTKKIVYDGDSICQGVYGGGGYAKIIADRTNGIFVNQAIGGGRLTTASNGATYHSVVDNIANLPKDGDLYCFEGGINDYWTPKALGTFSKTDFTGTLDTNTICGALETIFRYALTNFIGKPICFVITHKIQSTAYATNSSGNTFEDYRNAMVGICEKYSIPYYDAFSESGLNGWNTAQSDAFLTGCAEGTADGIHPNEEGYKRYYVPQLVALFEKIMPRY